MTATGGSPTNITNNVGKFEEDAPNWSPDGTEIAYAAGGIERIPATGGTPTNVSANGDEPSWSPDGTQIAYSGVYTVPAMGSGTPTLITGDQNAPQIPDWGVATTPENKPPTVDAGTDRTVPPCKGTITLSGRVSDDGLPNPPGALASVWTKESGPGNVSFESPASTSSTPTTKVWFDKPGKYELKLTANDGEKTTSDTRVVTVKSRRFEVKFMTFIPSNYINNDHLGITHPQSHCMRPIGTSPLLTLLIGAGDDRGFNPHSDFPHEPPEPFYDAPKYKTLQKVILEQVPDGQGGTKLQQVEIPDPQDAQDAGISRSFTLSALVNGILGRIDITDYDGVLGDCFLLHGAKRCDTDRMSVTATPSQHSPDLWGVNFNGKSTNGLVTLLAPAIDWRNLRVNIDASTAKPEVLINGQHDQFPAYEVYINDEPIYRFSPTARRLPVLRFSGEQDILTGLNDIRPIKPRVCILGNNDCSAIAVRR
jgi:hypothetical protein